MDLCINPPRKINKQDKKPRSYSPWRRQLNNVYLVLKFDVFLRTGESVFSIAWHPGIRKIVALHDRDGSIRITLFDVQNSAITYIHIYSNYLSEGLKIVKSVQSPHAGSCADRKPGSGLININVTSSLCTARVDEQVHSLTTKPYRFCDPAIRLGS